MQASDGEYVYWLDSDSFQVRYKHYRDGAFERSGSIQLPGSPTRVLDLLESAAGRLVLTWESGPGKASLSEVHFDADGKGAVTGKTESFNTRTEKLIRFHDRLAILSARDGRISFQTFDGNELQPPRTVVPADEIDAVAVLDAQDGPNGAQVLVHGEDPHGFHTLSEVRGQGASTLERVDFYPISYFVKSGAAFLPASGEHPALVACFDEDRQLHITSSAGEQVIPEESFAPKINAVRGPNGDAYVQWTNMSGPNLYRLPARGGEAEKIDLEALGDISSEVEVVASPSGVDLFWSELRTDPFSERETVRTAPLDGSLPGRARTLDTARPDNYIQIDAAYLDADGNPAVIWTESVDLEENEPLFSVRRAVRR